MTTITDYATGECIACACVLRVLRDLRVCRAAPQGSRMRRMSKLGARAGSRGEVEMLKQKQKRQQKCTYTVQ